MHELIAAATELPIKDQETLVQTSQQEFAQGECQAITPEQLMAELIG
ncbi:hypothetical protein PCC7418_2143 [Halothece sp. PCC 7418]|nr:hypothetical protein [Halothece sp. PCC 7418]AFZ44303.1 hypothetical protein PCC7418_2143 [Halothece sp. PCC 7418]